MKVEEDKVLIWMSSEGQPGHTTLGDVDCLQTKFGGKIDISVDDQLKFVRVYANDRETEASLKAFMAEHSSALKPRPMSRCNL